jgi:hypothetical protein
MQEKEAYKKPPQKKVVPHKRKRKRGESSKPIEIDEPDSKKRATSKSAELPIEGDESDPKEVVETDSNNGNSEKPIEVVGLDSMKKNKKNEREKATLKARKRAKPLSRIRIGGSTFLPIKLTLIYG